MKPEPPAPAVLDFAKELFSPSTPEPPPQEFLSLDDDDDLPARRRSKALEMARLRKMLALPICTMVWSVMSVFMAVVFSHNESGMTFITLISLSVALLAMANMALFVGLLIHLTYSGFNDKAARAACVAAFFGAAVASTMLTAMDSSKRDWRRRHGDITNALPFTC